MNRFSTYLSASKLVKLYIAAARQAASKEHRMAFEHNVLAALENLQAGMNNVASLYFEHRKKL